MTAPDWWWPLQRRIALEFGHEPRREAVAVRLLQRLAQPVGGLTPRLADRRVVVVGAGLRRDEPLPDGVLVAADGSARACRERGHEPTVVVTDLDGYADDLRWAARAGAAVVVHGHGDNLAALGHWLPRLRAAAVTAAAPAEGVTCWGGFTDGDRAVMLALAHGAREVRLAGFRFDAVGPYSGRCRPREKLRKLAWAEWILGKVAGRDARLRWTGEKRETNPTPTPPRRGG